MRKNRVARKRRGISLDYEQIETLLAGTDIFGVGKIHDAEARREAWLEIREEILAKWIDERPATRPHAWWEFEAPEPLRRLDGKPTSGPLNFGRQSGKTDDRGRRIDAGEYETEYAYLARLELLTEQERQYLVSNPPAESQDVLGGFAPACGRGIRVRVRG